jgi:cobalt-zinc-cadmium resistance protein CzcA
LRASSSLNGYKAHAISCRRELKELGPITTGLGEIFQYTLVSKDKKHDATELRTIQDYIVRPILRTVPGVTDVNSFGGLVKQYQVLVNPDRLTSSGITVAQDFAALARNNTHASANYIEHKSEQYVVRGLGLVNSGDIATSSSPRTSTLRATWLR